MSEDLNPRRAFLDQEAADAVVFVLGPDDGDIGDRTIGDPHLFAIEDVVAGAAHGAREHAAGIGAELRLGETETADGPAALQTPQPFFLLRGRAEFVDGIHHQRALHGNETAQGGIAALELLHHLAIGDVGHSGATVAGKIGAKKSQGGQLGEQLHGKGGFAIVPLDDGQDFVIDELARGLADEAIFVAEQGIEIEEVHPGKSRHGNSLGMRGIILARCVFRLT